MKMIRKFHPVGQGAFYTEIHNYYGGTFTIVYDCGSGTGDTTNTIINKEIDNAFQKDTPIDAIFISHLHMDHVNGLEYLISHFDVKKVFLPEITPSQKLYLYIQQRIQDQQNSFLENLILDPTLTLKDLKNDIEVILIPEIIESGTEINTEIVYFVEDLITGEIIKHGAKFKSKEVTDWAFIPFNLRQNITHSFTTFEEFEIKWKSPGNRAKIRKEYGRYNDELNANSMTLYSGPDSDETIFELSQLISCNFHCSHFLFRHLSTLHKKPACLYFGDFNAHDNRNWSAFKDYYKNYWDKFVGTVQIPHHGSKHNYNSEINQNPKFSVISAGSRNLYCHPSLNTVKEIQENGGIQLLVTELHGSFVMFEIIDLKQKGLLKSADKYNL